MNDAYSKKKEISFCFPYHHAQHNLGRKKFIRKKGLIETLDNSQMRKIQLIFSSSKSHHYSGLEK